MFYVASVIEFSAFLELLWNHTLLVRYKLNRFRPPWVEPFWYSCTVVWRIWKVLTVILNGIIWSVENWLQAVHRCHSYIWHCLRFVMESYFSIFNYSIGIILLAPHFDVVFYYHLSGRNNILSLNPNYWRNHLKELSCDVSL